MLIRKASAGSAVTPTYVDDVFSAFTYTGNGSTQTINNGIDLAGKGGLVWIKNRNVGSSHALFDTARTGSYVLRTDTTDVNSGPANYVTFNSNGFLVLNAFTIDNALNNSYASWTFRKAPKFFDIVTWTGNGMNGREISHNLGVTPGMIIIKSTSIEGSWYVNARDPNARYSGLLNTTGGMNPGNDPAHAALTNGYAYYIDDKSFTLAAGNTGAANVNANGVGYVAYIFAHDPAADGLIQCGSFTAGATVTLGWEPQYVLVKRIDSTGEWGILDSSRGMTVGKNDQVLCANTSDAEYNSGMYSAGRINPLAYGFTAESGFAGTSIYMAIRRSNKPPTSGTQVFLPALIGNAGDSKLPGFRTGFSVDMVLTRDRLNTLPMKMFTRLIGDNNYLITSGTSVEAADAIGKFGYPDGFNFAEITFTTTQYIGALFKRAVGVFDIVCYTGTGVAKTEAHGLGGAPELIITKIRSSTGGWYTYSAATGNTKFAELNTTAQFFTASTVWNNTTPTSSVFSVGTDVGINGSGITYVAYLFATKAGISKVGSYMGNGSSQTINCGFAAGARFVLVKRTDAAGDWFCFDTTRGIVAADDPHLSLNTTTAEVTTDDSVDPDSSGFIVNQVAATNINVTSATYIYLAMA